jgi:Polysaccharide lyase
MVRGCRCIVAALLALSTPAPAAELIEEFNGGGVDPAIWDDCQAPDGVEVKDVVAGKVTKRAVAIGVAETTENIEECLPPSPLAGAEVAADPDPLTTALFSTDVAAGADLGPSLVEPAVPPGASAADCPAGHPDLDNRNELRLQRDRTDLIHNATATHWYSLTFTTAGAIPPCGSARWILAQWKEPSGPSPFLAQRYDNGVLHVTVQNDICRCVVAQAAGNFDRTVMAEFGIANIAPQSLAKRDPIKCVRTDLPEGAKEESCEPQNMTVWTRGGLPPPDLPDPQKGWVTMTYSIKAGTSNGRIDVYAGKRFIVSVRGQVSYLTTKPGKVKFKFGHYRDRIPGAATVSYDRVCFSPSSDTCAAGLSVVP